MGLYKLPRLSHLRNRRPENPQHAKCPPIRPRQHLRQRKKVRRTRHPKTRPRRLPRHESRPRVCHPLRRPQDLRRAAAKARRGARAGYMHRRGPFRVSRLFRPPKPGWPASNYKNARVLLGCELSGAYSTPAAMPGIRLMTDLSMLTVRYVFLIPAGFSYAIRAHVEPAIGIAFASLRSGAV